MKSITNEEYLRKMTEFLNIYQDIEDVYEDHTITNEVRLGMVMKLVREFGRRVAKELPE